MSDRQGLVFGIACVLFAVLVCWWAANVETSWVVKDLKSNSIVYTRRVNDSLFSSHMEDREVFQK